MQILFINNYQRKKKHAALSGTACVKSEIVWCVGARHSWMLISVLQISSTTS